MCFSFSWLKREYKRLRDFAKPFDCSCEICGRTYDNMEKLVTHMGYHETKDLNRNLRHGYGTVRCNTCFRTFPSVAAMEEHHCSSVIQGLSPIHSSDSLESVLIHD